MKFIECHYCGSDNKYNKLKCEFCGAPLKHKLEAIKESVVPSPFRSLTTNFIRNFSDVATTGYAVSFVSDTRLFRP